MRKLIVSLSILAVAACSDNSNPAVAVIGTRADAIAAPSSPPPPPLDSGSYSSSEYGTSARINITYFLNKPGNHGWLTFQKDQAPGTAVDNNARITYSKGDVSGKGSLAYTVPGGVVAIDLSSVSAKSTFANSDGGYFSLQFDRGSFTSTGGKTMPLTRSTTFSMTPPKESCPGDRICGGK